MTNLPPRLTSPKPSVMIGVLLIVLAFLCVAIMSAFAKTAAGHPRFARYTAKWLICSCGF